MNMDQQTFRAVLQEHATRVNQRHELCKTEEASKTSLILPFLQNVLGYDVSDPSILIPEYDIPNSGDRHDHADYALIFKSKPEILIEAKWNGLSLDSYTAQLGRYFNATSARIGILTNGVLYRFFGDLNSDDEMDLSSFMEVNMLSLTERDADYLFRFHADQFNPASIVKDVTDLKAYQDIKKIIRQILDDPDKTFASYIRARLNKSKSTRTSSTNLQAIVKQVIDECMTSEQTEHEQSHDPHTRDEYEAFFTVQALLFPAVNPRRLEMKSTRQYFSIDLDGISTHWICRFYPAQSAWWTIHLPTEIAKRPEVHILKDVDTIFLLRERLIQAARKYDPTISFEEDPGVSYIHQNPE